MRGLVELPITLRLYATADVILHRNICVEGFVVNNDRSINKKAGRRAQLFRFRVRRRGGQLFDGDGQLRSFGAAASSVKVFMINVRKRRAHTKVRFWIILPKKQKQNSKETLLSGRAATALRSFGVLRGGAGG